MITDWLRLPLDFLPELYSSATRTIAADLSIRDLLNNIAQVAIHFTRILGLGIASRDKYCDGQHHLDAPAASEAMAIGMTTT